MNAYHQLIAEYVRLAQAGKQCPLGGLPARTAPAPAPDVPTALLFSPHPDDESITGGLALRLHREAALRIRNVALTLGSNLARQAERLGELQQACGYLGFDLLTTGPRGLENINCQTRAANPAAWRDAVRIIAGILTDEQPRVIFLPHERDWNATHIGTHWLVVDALSTLPPGSVNFTPFASRL